VSSARAIGWDNDDFLIGGGPSFTTRIGVFDHDLTFKGLLDSNFVTVAGMDFDAAGRLVAVASGNVRSVRVYDSSGVIVGGFTRNDDLLGTSADLKVAPNGNYIIATQNFGGGDGAREFMPDGSFVRQYGSGWITGAVVLPGNRLWTGGPGFSSINVFDLTTGAQTGSLTIPGVHGVFGMNYDSLTNTVLIANYSASATFECDLSGNVLRSFDSAPLAASTEAATRGPNCDVFVTTGSRTVLHWRADGSFVESVSTASSIGFPGAIMWAGNLPEPSATGVLTGTLVCALRRSRRTA
jgi:WD40 repeat protein